MPAHELLRRQAAQQGQRKVQIHAWIVAKKTAAPVAR
jgi:hypothetical protein